jgi:DNA-binding NarL/FixJ family response regulator
MDQNKKTKVLIADDHQIFRDGIVALFIGSQSFVIAGEACDSESLFGLLQDICPDIILLDINMPGMNGIEIAKKLKAEKPEIKIVMLSANSDEQSITDSVKAGAHGFLDKNCTSAELFDALQKTTNNQNYFSDNITNVVFKSFVHNVHNEKDKDLEKLSQREIEIIKLISDGLIFKEIADKLNISPRTVEAHKNNILEKLQISTTAELIKFAIKHQITTI